MELPEGWMLATEYAGARVATIAESGVVLTHSPHGSAVIVTRAGAMDPDNAEALARRLTEAVAIARAWDAESKP